MKTILIVEDEREIIELLSFALSGNGYNVIESNDGQQGYEQYRTKEIDLIETDVMMPNIDGYNL